MGVARDRASCFAGATTDARLARRRLTHPSTGVFRLGTARRVVPAAPDGRIEIHGRVDIPDRALHRSSRTSNGGPPARPGRPVSAPSAPRTRSTAEVLGYDRGTTQTSPPASTTFTPTRSRSRAIAASATAPANREPRNIPRTDRSSTPTRPAVLATDVDAVSPACRLTAATRAWSRASLTTAFRRFADPRHFLLTARPARRTRLASAAAPLGFAKRSTIPPSTDARTASVFRPTSSPALHAGAGRRRRSQSRLIDRYHASASRVTLAVLTRPRQRTRSAIRIQPSFGTRTPRPSNPTSWLVRQAKRPRVALRHRPARQPRPAPRPRLAQRAKLQPIHPCRRLHHPPEPRCPPHARSQTVQILLRRVRVRRPLRPRRAPTCPAGEKTAGRRPGRAAGDPTRTGPSSTRAAPPRTTAQAHAPGPPSDTTGCDERSPY